MVQIRKPGNKRNINSGVVSHDAEVRVLLDNGNSNLVRYAINIPNTGRYIRYAFYVVGNGYKPV